MPELHHQIARVERGSHTSPDRGMCAVELASLLAGERFSDHPRSVCRVIAAFVRAYNDRVDSDRRQDLVPYAARIVGTRADRRLQRARAVRCAEWAAERSRSPVSRLLSSRARRVFPMGTGAGLRAARAGEAVTDATHAAALALLDELIALGAAPSRVPDAPRLEDAGQAGSGCDLSGRDASRPASGSTRASR